MFRFVSLLHYPLKLRLMQWRVVLHSLSGGLLSSPLGRSGSLNVIPSPISHLPTFHCTALQALIFHAMNAWHRLHWLFCFRLHCRVPGSPYGWHLSLTIRVLRQLPTSSTRPRCRLQPSVSGLHCFPVTAVSSWMLLTSLDQRMLKLTSLADGVNTNPCHPAGLPLDDDDYSCATFGSLILKCILSRRMHVFLFRFPNRPCWALRCSSLHLMFGGLWRFVTASLHLGDEMLCTCLPLDCID